MRGEQFFRIGAIVLVVMGIAHLFGHFGGKAVPPANSTEIALHDMMYGYKQNLSGSMRSAGDIYDGLSLAFSVFSFALGMLAWVTEPNRKAAWILAVWLVVATGISFAYWFAIPTFFLAVAAACFLGYALLNR
jgi:hypothetical protein